MTYRFHLGLPPRESHQQFKGHWSIRAKAVREYRAEAGWTVLEQVGASARPRHQELDIELQFNFHTRRKRDRLNFLGAMKPVWDGFQDAKLIEDDSGVSADFRSPWFTVDKTRPKGVTIWIEGR